MIKIAGVRFRGSGKIYYFDPGMYAPKNGDHVIVDTARGIEYGVVCGAVKEMEEDKIPQPLRPILRVADEVDEERIRENQRKEKEAMVICREKIRARELEMKLIDAEYTFDNNKILFYFTADGRIDFRELVKDLAGVFRTRIELRQIGVRDETKILGGIGICGRPLCCHTYLTDFVPVSIKMAKEQNLSLNPTKISGTCGRLMCCLKNEEDTYEYLNSKLPSVGEMVTTPSGAVGKVTSVSVLRQRVKVVIEENDEKEVQEYAAEDLKFRSGKGKEHGGKKHSHKEHKEEAPVKENKEPKERKVRENAEGSEPRERKNRENMEGSEPRERKNRENAEGSEPRERKNRENTEGSEPRERKNRENAEGSEPRERKNRGKQPPAEAQETGAETAAAQAKPEESQGREDLPGQEEKKERSRRSRYRRYRGKKNSQGEGE